MVYYKDKTKNMIQDEPMQYTMERYKTYLRDVLAFQDTHQRVHYCCYGPNLCPICPSIQALQDAVGDMDWLLHQLKRKYKLQVYRHIKKNDTWTWNIRETPTLPT